MIDLGSESDSSLTSLDDLDEGGPNVGVKREISVDLLPPPPLPPSHRPISTATESSTAASPPVFSMKIALLQSEGQTKEATSNTPPIPHIEYSSFAPYLAPRTKPKSHSSVDSEEVREWADAAFLKADELSEHPTAQWRRTAASYNYFPNPLITRPSSLTKPLQDEVTLFPERNATMRSKSPLAASPDQDSIVVEAQLDPKNEGPEPPIIDYDSDIEHISDLQPTTQAAPPTIPDNVQPASPSQSPKIDLQVRRALTSLHYGVLALKNANPFVNPAFPKNTAASQTYSDVVYHPMDLVRIKKMVASGEITTLEEYERALVLIIANAMVYNGRYTATHQQATDVSIKTFAFSSGRGLLL